MGRLRVSGNTPKPRKVMSSLGHRLYLATNETVSCWMVQHNGGALLDGNITDYIIKRGKTLTDTSDANSSDKSVEIKDNITDLENTKNDIPESQEDLNRNDESMLLDEFKGELEQQTNNTDYSYIENE